jgi:hypothetical protein
MNFRLLACRLLACIVLVSAYLSLSTAYAQELSKDKKAITNTVYLQGGAYIHWNDDDDEHTDAPLFMSAEIQRSDQWLYGLGLFNNSFNQFSQYLYGGYTFKFKNSLENFHAKITAGIVHGYTGKYKDKLDYNNSGFAPAIIPGLGWKKDKLGFDVILLGSSGLLFTIGYDVFEF